MRRPSGDQTGSEFRPGSDVSRLGNPAPEFIGPDVATVTGDRDDRRPAHHPPRVFGARYTPGGAETGFSCPIRSTQKNVLSRPRSTTTRPRRRACRRRTRRTVRRQKTTRRLCNLIDKGNRPTGHLEPPDVEWLCQQTPAERVDEVTCREVARIGASRYNDLPGTAVERLHDDPRVVPGLSCLREREEDGAPARQELRAVRALTRIQLHEILRCTPGAGGHSPDPVRTLPIQDRVVGCPARAQRAPLTRTGRWARRR